jgi:hypothetical protein
MNARTVNNLPPAAALPNGTRWGAQPPASINGMTIIAWRALSPSIPRAPKDGRRQSK